MGKKRRIVFFDKSEIVFNIWAGSGYASYDLNNTQILKITIDKYARTVWAFMKKPDERIRITTSKYPGPIIITKGDNKEVYEEHKAEILEYAEKYRIRVEDLSNEDYVDDGIDPMR